MSSRLTFPVVAAAVVAAVAAGVVVCGFAPEAPAVSSKQQRGVALGLFASDPRYDYAHFLDEIRATGARQVLIAVVWMQRDVRAARIHRVPGHSADDDVIVRTLRQAKERGLEATLFPIVRLEQHTPKEWRGKIVPLAGVDAWFDSYRDFIMHMAALADAGGAARFSVGSELVSLEEHEARWRALIGEVRGRFRGRLLYSANWDHFVSVPFWDAVDEVGVTAYFELSPDERLPDDAALDAAWRAPRESFAALAKQTGKPVVVTEVGYPSLVGAARYPWNETTQAPIDLAGQEKLIDAFCRNFAGHGVVDGFYVWNWFGWGGAADGSYTPRGKPGARAVERCMQAAW